MLGKRLMVGSALHLKTVLSAVLVKVIQREMHVLLFVTV
jgi:hypothetical protein